MRNWRANNHDALLAYRREYYIENQKHISELRKTAWLKKKNRVNGLRRERHAHNPEPFREYDRLRYHLDPKKKLVANKRYRDSHPEDCRKRAEKYRLEHPDQMRLWRKRNPDYMIDYNRRRNGASPYQFARGDSCCVCGLTNEASVEKYGRRLDVHHVDHDLTNNSVENLVTVCRRDHYKLDEELMLNKLAYGQSIPVVE
jgi:hypothetical protein